MRRVAVPLLAVAVVALAVTSRVEGSGGGSAARSKQRFDIDRALTGSGAAPAALAAFHTQLRNGGEIERDLRA